MTVKDYLPIEDAKLTVEKPVKEKPTTAELTTIEKPGKPVPATQLENTKVKKPIRKSKKSFQITEKSQLTKIEKPKADSILIITEKPQAAQKIAQALGNPRRYYENNASYYELERDNKKILVASAVGHIFNLTSSPGQKGWPIFKLEWVPSYKSKQTAYTKVYFDLLKKLSQRSKEFYLASDYDIEGELIGWNILRFICAQKTAKRMKFSTLTQEELKNAFENPLPEPDWGQAYAGETRHILDWLYGINLSRALMSAIKKVGSFKILSIGRVQGPALKIIVEREKEITAFKPQPYWQVLAFSNNIEFKYPKDIFNKEDLEIFKKIKSANAETKKTEEHILPPYPFDLTTLQREAFRWHGISPSQTLQIAQKLYLDSLISYPRTSSQKIPDAIQPRKILKELEKNFPELTKSTTRQKPIEGKKSDPAHPSIFPTGEFKELSGNDLKLYNLIVKRFISAFSPDLKTANKRIILTTNQKDPLEPEKHIIFTTSGLKIIDKGWTNVYPNTLEEKDLPDLYGRVKIDEIKFLEKETQPPKRYTPTSLITTLEKKNLGTKTTRSIIVDTLFERGYLEGQSIKATPLGMKLIETLEKNSPIIIDENLTRKMEEEINTIQTTSANLEQKEKEIIQKAEHIITDISKDFKTKEQQIGKEILEGIEDLRKEEQNNNTIIKCLTCKQGNLRILYSKQTQRYFVACSAYPNCKQTYSLPPNALIKKSEKNCESCHFPKLLSIKKGKRPWEFCFNPNCETNKQRLENYQKYKSENQNKEK